MIRSINIPENIRLYRNPGGNAVALQNAVEIRYLLSNGELDHRSTVDANPNRVDVYDISGYALDRKPEETKEYFHDGGNQTAKNAGRLSLAVQAETGRLAA